MNEISTTPPSPSEPRPYPPEGTPLEELRAWLRSASDEELDAAIAQTDREQGLTPEDIARRDAHYGAMTRELDAELTRDGVIEGAADAAVRIVDQPPSNPDQQ